MCRNFLFIRSKFNSYAAFVARLQLWPLVFICIFFNMAYSSSAIQGIDAVVENKGRIHLFKFSSWKCASLNNYLDLENLEWKSLLRPEFDFVPYRILNGQGDNILVFDVGGKKIWQLNSGMQFLSHYPVPKEIISKNLAEMEILFALDFKIYFVFPSLGRAYQYHVSGQNLNFIREFKVPSTCRSFVKIPQTIIANYGFKNGQFICREKENIKVFDAFLTAVESPEFLEASKKENGNSFLTLKPKLGTGLRFPLGDKHICFYPKQGQLELCK